MNAFWIWCLFAVAVGTLGVVVWLALRRPDAGLSQRVEAGRAEMMGALAAATAGMERLEQRDVGL